MAPIVTRQVPLVGALDWWDFYGTGDPSTAPGVPASVGSRFSASDGASGTVLYVKFGAGDTDWESAGTGGGGGGGVSSVTGTAPITAAPTTGAVVVSHDASGVVAGTYGDAETVPVVTVNATGHVTAVTEVAISYADAFVPITIFDGETWTVPENRQALFAYPIEIQGELVVDGALIMVD